MQTGFCIFTGSNMRAVVSFCRRAKALGVPFYLIARTSIDPIFHTAYAKNVVATRAKDALQLDDVERCLQLVNQAAELKQMVVCPTSEFFDLFMLENSTLFAQYHCHIPLVDLATYRVVSNKESFTDLCAQHGLTVPKVVQRPEALAYPFVAKPRNNLGENGRILYPYLIFNNEHWQQFLANETPENFFFQEYIMGRSFYLLFYFSRSGTVTAFSQENLAQQAGGKSIVLARSAHIHELPIAEKYVNLLQLSGFHGLAMIELKQAHSTADFVFIELNPRFWGPSQLFVDAQAPLFDAFIADYGGKVAATAVLPHEATYFWLNGLLDSWRNCKEVTWYGYAPFSLAGCIARNLRHDVYLRRDTYRYFWRELLKVYKGLP